MRTSLVQRSGDQTVWLYGPDGYSVLSETRQFLVGAMPTQSGSEHIWLPTASGPMPLVVVMDGQPLAVHADQPLPDAYSLRYPGQVDDGNGLFYNFNRFYDARSGRYTQADPIGLEGGWNRFGYVGGDPLSFSDPEGLRTNFTSPYGRPQRLLSNRELKRNPDRAPSVPPRSPRWSTNPDSQRMMELLSDLLDPTDFNNGASPLPGPPKNPNCIVVCKSFLDAQCRAKPSCECVDGPVMGPR